MSPPPSPRLNPICDLTWEAVRQRSEAKLAPGLFCADCYVMFHDGGVPCLKHTLPVEQRERDARITEMFKARFG
jgi:hypothetical protein